jgi:hypothetical protein
VVFLFSFFVQGSFQEMLVMVLVGLVLLAMVLMYMLGWWLAMRLADRLGWF